MTTYPPHTPVDPEGNVIWAIRKVMEELPSIGKDQQAAAQQGGYAYRGIEQILGRTQQLCAKHGVVFVPRVKRQWTIDIELQNRPWTDTFLEVEYTVYGPKGPSDSMIAGPVVAIGRDNSDKGANKAMTQAYKQILLQVFQIGDKTGDADGTTHEADGPAGPSKEMKDAMDGLVMIINTVDEDQDELKHEIRLQFGSPDSMDLDDIKGACHLAAGWPGTRPVPPDLDGTF